jgi:hypothetical protein
MVDLSTTSSDDIAKLETRVGELAGLLEVYVAAEERRVKDLRTFVSDFARAAATAALNVDRTTGEQPLTPSASYGELPEAQLYINPCRS